MLPIAHRPLISYAISWLEEAGISNAIVCGNRETRELGDLVARNASPNIQVSYREDAMPRGAAGCVRDAAEGSAAGTFVVTDGTAIPNVDLADLLRTHRESGAVATVVINCEPRPLGNPGLKVPTGIYVFEKKALELVPIRGFYDIKEKLIPQLYRAGLRVLPYRSTPIPRVMGLPTYLTVNDWVVEHLIANDQLPDGYLRWGAGLRHRDSVVADDVVCVGPVMVGPGTRIGSGAVIVGPTSIGCDVTVERNVVISRSAVWRRSSIGADAMVDRSLLADDTIVVASEQTFRTVRVSAPASRRQPNRPAVRAVDSTDVLPQNLRQRFARVLAGTNLSRSPAAQ
jgi:NDP-sugar pyrophosphorylase family protein